jgi:hypothetical protein
MTTTVPFTVLLHAEIFNRTGWIAEAVQAEAGLHRELQLDMQRLWIRNLGRDDRLIGEFHPYPIKNAHGLGYFIMRHLFILANHRSFSSSSDDKCNVFTYILKCKHDAPRFVC